MSAMIRAVATVHHPRFSAICADGTALLVESNGTGVGEDLEALPLGGIADRHDNARDDQLYAQQRRGEPDGDEVQ